MLLLRLFVAAVIILCAAGDHSVIKHGLSVTIRDQSLEGAPSCQHSLAQIELLNVVRSY